MADLRGNEIKDSYQNVVTRGTGNKLENGNGVEFADLDDKASLSGGVDANFLLMPQVGGIPIVERDSNDDGVWIRLSNGVQICLSGTLSVSGTDPVGEIFRSYPSERANWAFPMPFINSSAVVSPFTGTTQGAVSFTGGSIGHNSSVSASLLNASGQINQPIKLQAIGLW